MRKRKRARDIISVSLSCFSASEGEKTRRENESGKITSSASCSGMIANLRGNGRVGSSCRCSINSVIAYLRMSTHSGWAPRRAFLVACIRHGSSRMQAFGPSSLRICRSAIATLMAVSESSLWYSIACRRLRLM